MVKTIVLTQHEGVRFSARCGDNEVIIDWNEEEGGTNQGVSPGELLCASVGACVVMNVIRYFKTLGVPLEGARAETTHGSDERGSRAKGFEVRVALPIGLPKREKAVRRVADLCYVKNTLTTPPEFTAIIEGPGFD